MNTDKTDSGVTNEEGRRVILPCSTNYMFNTYC